MHENKGESASLQNVLPENQRIQRITLWGSVVNLVLAALKITGGLFSGSLALVADGVHSLSDLLTDIFVLLGVWLGSKPPDQDHPYGHGRFETFAAIAVALALLLAGGGIAWEAGLALYQHKLSFPGPLVVVLALLSLVAKEILYQLTRRIALDTGSSSLLANAWHHRSDALSSLAILIGGIAGLLGWGYGDQVAGLVVGLMVCGVGVNIALKNLSQLVDPAVPPPLLQQIHNIIDQQEEIREWHHLRTRKVGRQIFLDVHILVDAQLTVFEGHHIAECLEEYLAEVLSQPLSAVIHVEPYLPAESLSPDCDPPPLLPQKKTEEDRQIDRDKTDKITDRTKTKTTTEKTETKVATEQLDAKKTEESDVGGGDARESGVDKNNAE